MTTPIHNDEMPPDIGPARHAGYTRVWMIDQSCTDLPLRDYESLSAQLATYDRIRDGHDVWWVGKTIHGARTRVRLDTITALQAWTPEALRACYADTQAIEQATKRASWQSPD